MDWKTQTNEFYIIKGRQKFAGKRFSLSDVSNQLKVARYSFSGPIPSKFEHKLRRHKQSFVKIATPVVLDKDENLL